MNIMAYIIVGITLGILFAHYQLCFSRAVRGFISFRRKNKIIIFLVMVIASAVFFNFFIGIGLLQETVKPLTPISFLGGVFFGIGMVVAGGCAAGTLYRVGEGNIPSLITTLGMVVGMGAFGFIIASHFTKLSPHFVHKTILNQFHVNPLLFSFIAAVFAIIALVYIMAEHPETKRKFKLLFTISFVVVLNVAILNSLFYFSYSNCQEMSPFLLKEVLARGEDVVILDIRPEKFFKKGHIKGAISKDNLPNGLKDMDKYKDKMVVVVCGEGIISELFCIKMNKTGFKKIYNLKGGMSTWH